MTELQLVTTKPINAEERLAAGALRLEAAAATLAAWGRGGFTDLPASQQEVALLGLSETVTEGLAAMVVVAEGGDDD